MKRSGPSLVLAVAVATLVAAAPACDRRVGVSGRVTVVASIYPLAWMAGRIGGDPAGVRDLTPPGVEAHDAVLTARQRADIEAADVVVYLGDIGFQPDVEQAVSDANGQVVDLSGFGLLPGEGAAKFDPHVWLDPLEMAGFASRIGNAFQKADPARLAENAGRESALIDDLLGLRNEFKEGLSSCRYETFVASHEAFGYLAAAYGLHQIGIQGLIPESEPSASRIQAARTALADGTAAPFVFYENTDEGKRIAESVAADSGVPTLPLNILETAPASGDYLSVMRDNLATLREGLECK